MKKHITTIVTVSALALFSLKANADDLPVSAAEQKALTPDSALQNMLEGNQRYMKGKLSNPSLKSRRAAAVEGQTPQAIVLSCIDSRVPVEKVFDQGLGDIFVSRVAGNIENVDQLGSIEYAAKVAGVKLVIVMGHESCGAVKSACDGVELGNITALLSNILPAVEAVEGYDEKGRTSKNKEFVKAVTEENVRMTVKNIRERSEVLAEMESKGEIKIVGAVYSLHDGSVSMLD